MLILPCDTCRAASKACQTLGVENGGQYFNALFLACATWSSWAIEDLATSNFRMFHLEDHVPDIFLFFPR